MVENYFRDKTLVITGGTGSFGRAVLKRFLDSGLKEIRIFSRDELKQDVLRREVQNSKVKFFLGDVRDKGSVRDLMEGVDFVFHAAALKQVPSCEFYPMQAIQTNVIGTENVLNAALDSGVKKVICLSTDKAVYPINVMGMSKALMERLVLAKSQTRSGSVLCCTRYGNVMASRGSVIPLFVDQIKNNKPLTITDPKMTRFMMSLDDAVDLVLFAFEKGKSGDIFVRKAPAATIDLVARTLQSMLGSNSNELKIIGTRHGEKLYETLLTREEMIKAVDMGHYFRIPADGRDLNYELFVESGEKSVSSVVEYHSHNAYQLNESELRDMLLQLHELKETLENFRVVK